LDSAFGGNLWLANSSGGALRVLVDGISATNFGLAVERLSFVYGYHAFFGCVSNCPCLHRFGGLHV
jgi:hypothetical protein